jgi:hypothetical protein
MICCDNKNILGYHATDQKGVSILGGRGPLGPLNLPVYATYPSCSKVQVVCGDF